MKSEKYVAADKPVGSTKLSRFLYFLLHLILFAKAIVESIPDILLALRDFFVDNPKSIKGQLALGE
jgi:hypothetical protein